MIPLLVSSLISFWRFVSLFMGDKLRCSAAKGESLPLLNVISDIYVQRSTSENESTHNIL